MNNTQSKKGEANSDSSNGKGKGGDFQLQIDGEKLDFYLGFVLDGEKSFKNLSEALPDLPGLTIYVQLPEFDPFQPEVLQYKPTERIHISGKRLDQGLQVTDYRVTVGVSDCGELDLTSTELSCLPPEDEPTAEGETAERKHSVLVYPGTNIKKHHIGK